MLNKGVSMRKLGVVAALMLAFVMFSGFWSGENPNQLKNERVQASHDTLNLLYKYAPEAKSMVANSYGYATFANVGVNAIFFSVEGGKGLAKVNSNGNITYMNMASGGIGFGLGIKDFRIVFLFETKKAFDYFVEHGWEANAQADAAAKLGGDGGALNAAITVAPGVRIYKLTQNGLAIQATIQGTKYWADGDLN
jgi:lipid-binding SYLF domain-containing protein